MNSCSDIVDILDELGVDEDASDRRARNALRETGWGQPVAIANRYRASNETLRAAVKIRQARVTPEGRQQRTDQRLRMRTLALVFQLDWHGAPSDMTTRQARKYLQQIGVKASNDMLREAVRLRRGGVKALDDMLREAVRLRRGGCVENTEMT